MNLKTILKSQQELTKDRDNSLEALKKIANDVSPLVYRHLRNEVYELYQPAIDKTFTQFEAIQAYMIENQPVEV